MQGSLAWKISYFSPTGFNESQLQEVYAAETQLGQLDNGEFQHTL